jgi:WD40 repeat protein
MPELRTRDERPRFELREVWDDHSSRVEVCSLREVVGRVGDVALSRRSLWGLSALVGGGLLGACAPTSEPEQTLKANVQPTAAPTVRPLAVTAAPTTAQLTASPTTARRAATSSPTPDPNCADRLAHGGPVLGIALSPDGTLVASAGVTVSGTDSTDHAVKLWRASDGKLLQTLRGRSGYVVKPAFSPDGQLIAAGSVEGTVYLWRTTDGGLARELSWPSSTVSSISALAISPDGAVLAAANYLGQVGLWNPATGDRKRVLPDQKENTIFALAFSPDGKTLAVGTFYPGIVRFWSVANGARLREQTMGELVLSLAWSPDGKKVAVGGMEKVYLLDGTTGRSTGAIELSGTDPSADNMAFGQKSTRVFVGRGDGGLSIAALDGGTPQTVAAHTSGSTSLALDREATRLASAGGDGRIRLWDLTTTLQPIARCFADPAVPAASQLVTRYETEDSTGKKLTYTTACGGTYPLEATCTCNCVPGSPSEISPTEVIPTETPSASESPTETPSASESPTETPSASESPTETPSASESPTETPSASGGVIPGGSYCRCNKVCTCIPVRKYCFVMWK